VTAPCKRHTRRVRRSGTRTRKADENDVD